MLLDVFGGADLDGVFPRELGAFDLEVLFKQGVSIGVVGVGVDGCGVEPGSSFGAFFDVAFEVDGHDFFCFLVNDDALDRGEKDAGLLSWCFKVNDAAFE